MESMNYRKKYEAAQPEKFKSAKKEKGETQDPYSHLLDAHFAFMIIANKHKNDGSIKLNIPDNISLQPAKKDEKAAPDLFAAVTVSKNEMQLADLARQKPNENFAQHRSFMRDTFYAIHYLPILFKREDDQLYIRAGFHWKNSATATQQEKQKRAA